jgi:serine/threonine protein kinase
VYRDIKQENIGFDVRGDVKVFDFGLCKGLSASLKARDKDTGEKVYGYKLTRLTGSLPYMAPEVFAGRPYDGKCDVYSFAILLWEMFTLQPAFRSIIQAEYKTRILEREERLPLQRRGDKIPALIQAVIKESWQTDPKERPAMDRVARMIRGEMNLRCDNDDAIVRRTIHMNNRSRHSLRMGVSEEGPSTMHAPELDGLDQFSGPSLHDGLDA